MKTIVVSGLLLLVGCSERREYAPELLGTWENTFLMLESADVSEMDPRFEVFVADSNNWERVMGIKPVRTTYQADGTLSAEYRNLLDSVYTVAGGTWHTRDDSLYFFQWKPDTFIATWRFAVAMDTLKMWGIVDWERDGVRNDKYYGTQKRITID